MSRKIVNCPYCGKISPRDLWIEKPDMKNLGIKCPQCGCVKVWKDGKRYTSFDVELQRYLCRNCGYRFSKQ